MEAIVRVSPDLTFKIEGDNQRAIFEGIASVQEIFGKEVCGMCKSEDTRFNHREIDGNHFYERKCNKCFATKTYGCTKVKNGLFPHLKDDNGKYLPNKGWSVYVKPAEEKK